MKLITIALPQASAFALQGDRTVLVDTGVPGSQDRILAVLQRKGTRPEAVSLIFLTHGHIDHLGSARALRDITGAKIAIHQADAGMARGTDSRRPRPATPLGHAMAIALGKSKRPPETVFEPDILAGVEFDLRPYGVEARAIHTPGHTDGSMSVLLATGEAVVGDLIMADLPRMRTPGIPMFVNDLRQLQESVALVLAQNPSLIYCAHGGPFRPEAVRKRYKL